MKRVAVLGGTGMAGHVVSIYLEEQDYEVFIASKSAQNGLRSKSIDVTKFNDLAQWFEEIKPDVIINCIGILQKQADAYPHIAILINSYLPHWLENTFKDTETKIIQLSTDCVFSGNKGCYTENDTPDGMTFYDRSKALGEINNKKDLTFRMSIIGPDKHENGTGLFHWFMGQSGEIRGYINVIWNGITTIQLAKAIDAAIKQDISGLYQLVPCGNISKYDLLCLFQKVNCKKDVSIIPFHEVFSNKTLVNTRSDFDFELKSYPEQIREMKAWTDTHKALYSDRYYVNDSGF